MKYFVFQFCRPTRELTWAEHASADEALADLRVKESERAPEMEVVLLMARDIEELRKTHGRYFMDASGLAAQLQSQVLSRLSRTS